MFTTEGWWGEEKVRNWTCFETHFRRFSVELTRRATNGKAGFCLRLR